MHRGTDTQSHRDGHTQTHTDAGTHAQGHRHAHRDRHTQTPTDMQAHTHRGTGTHIRTETDTQRHTHRLRQTYRKAQCTQSHIQKHTHGDAGTQRHRYTQSHIQRYTDTTAKLTELPLRWGSMLSTPRASAAAQQDVFQELSIAHHQCHPPPWVRDKHRESESGCYQTRGCSLQPPTQDLATPPTQGSGGGQDRPASAPLPSRT